MFSQSKYQPSKKRSHNIDNPSVVDTPTIVVENDVKKSKQEITDSTSSRLLQLINMLFDYENITPALEHLSLLQQEIAAKKIDIEQLFKLFSVRDDHAYTLMQAICFKADPRVIKAVIACFDEKKRQQLLKQPHFASAENKVILALHLLVKNKRLKECDPKLREELISLFENLTIQFTAEAEDEKLTWIKLHQRYPHTKERLIFTENLNMAWRAMVQARQFIGCVSNHTSMNAKTLKEYYHARAKLAFARTMGGRFFANEKDFIHINSAKDYRYFKLVKESLISLHQSVGNCSEYASFVCRELLKMNYAGQIEIVNLKPGDHALVIIGEGVDRVVIDAWANDIYSFDEAAQRMQNFTTYSNKHRPHCFITFPVDLSFQKIISISKFHLADFIKFVDQVNAKAEGSDELIPMDMLDILKNKHEQIVIKYLKCHPSAVNLTTIDSIAVGIENHRFRIDFKLDEKIIKTLRVSYIQFMDYAEQQLYEDILSSQKKAVINYLNRYPDYFQIKPNEMVSDLVFVHKGLVEVKRIDRFTLEPVMVSNDLRYNFLYYFNETYKIEKRFLFDQHGDTVLAELKQHYTEWEPKRIEITKEGYIVYFNKTQETLTLSYEDFSAYAEAAKSERQQASLKK